MPLGRNMHRAVEVIVVVRKHNPSVTTELASHVLHVDVAVVVLTDHVSGRVLHPMRGAAVSVNKLCYPAHLQDILDCFLSCSRNGRIREFENTPRPNEDCHFSCLGTCYATW